MARPRESPFHRHRAAVEWQWSPLRRLGAFCASVARVHPTAAVCQRGFRPCAQACSKRLRFTATAVKTSCRLTLRRPRYRARRAPCRTTCEMVPSIGGRRFIFCQNSAVCISSRRATTTVVMLVNRDGSTGRRGGTLGAEGTGRTLLSEMRCVGQAPVRAVVDGPALGFLARRAGGLLAVPRPP